MGRILGIPAGRVPQSSFRVQSTSSLSKPLLEYPMALSPSYSLPWYALRDTNATCCPDLLPNSFDSSSNPLPLRPKLRRLSVINTPTPNSQLLHSLSDSCSITEAAR